MWFAVTTFVTANCENHNNAGMMQIWRRGMATKKLNLFSWDMWCTEPRNDKNKLVPLGRILLHLNVVGVQYMFFCSDVVSVCRHEDLLDLIGEGGSPQKKLR